MSTIATPRDGASTPVPRRTNTSTQQQQPHTPTSSTRPSLDSGPRRSLTSSPNPNITISNSNSNSITGTPTSSSGPATTTTTAAARRNRAALREYYNLKKATAVPTLEVTEDGGHFGGSGGGGGGGGVLSEIPPSEMDDPSFDAAAFVAKTVAESSLADLLRIYAKVLGETRALDAEKKALVYDNYSKLIAATETIRKMRANMDPLNPMASTLDPAIAQIYVQASSIREAMRREVSPSSATQEDRQRRGPATEEGTSAKRERTRRLAQKVLETPDRLRRLVAEGRGAEAAAEWELPRRLLVTWKEKGLGGDDVSACLEEGDAALRSDGDGVSSSSSEGT